jgi:hypothetical protein
MTTTPLFVPRQTPAPRKPEPAYLARFTPTQLDAALTAAGWPTWTGRAACPMTLAPVPASGWAQARRFGLVIPPQALRAWIGGWTNILAWKTIADELFDVAPDVWHVVEDRGLIHVESINVRGRQAAAWWLLGVGVEGL